MAGRERNRGIIGNCDIILVKRSDASFSDQRETVFICIDYFTNTPKPGKNHSKVFYGNGVTLNLKFLNFKFRSNTLFYLFKELKTCKIDIFGWF